MDAPVPLIVAALLAAAALVAPSSRGRAWAMLAALVLAPAILVAHISSSDQVAPLRHHPARLAAVVVAGVVVVVALAVLFHRRPAALPVAAVATLPFRVPIATGGSTANLLVPLYLVVAGGALAYLVPRLGGEPVDDGLADVSPGVLDWLLGLSVALYGIQAAYSSDFGRALENVVFFYVPFALLFALLRRVVWTPTLLRACLGVLVCLALVLAGIGFVEYATRHVFLNPKVIASNQLEDYFRVNSLFFDPNIYGRFLAIVMILVTGWLLWAARRRDVIVAAAILAVLWAALVLTFSQSSFTALLVGLAVLGGLRWNPRRALVLAVAAVVVAAAFVAVSPSTVRLQLGSSKSANQATSGRYALVKGGASLFKDHPIAGYGSGSFPREYRRKEKVSAQRATSASHTIPITVAAEQGVIGLALYVALLAAAFGRLFRRARSSVARASVAAAFAALVVHTLMYAAFLEDPLTWTLLGVAVALAAQAPPEHRRPRVQVGEPAAAAV